MADAEPVTGTQPAPAGARIDAIDTLRGVGVLGIFAMNIQVFSMPEAAYFNPDAVSAVLPFEGIDRWVHYAVHMLFDRKMMAIFSMLFGVGVMLFARKAEREGGPPLPLVRARWHLRCGWLLVVGLAHAYLLWHGDVLVLYAVCGLTFLWWARRLPAAWLVGVGAAMIGVAAAFWTLDGVGIAIASSPEVRSALEIDERTARGIKEGYAVLLPTQEQLRETIATYRSGYAEIFSHRAPLVRDMILYMIPFWGVWRAGGLMLLGMALYKGGYLTGERPARALRRLCIAGYAVGLPLVVGGLVFMRVMEFHPAWVYTIGLRFNEFGSVAVALGHVGLVLLVARAGALPGLRARLADVGRMALSAYLAQTIIATTIFYGYGFGRFGAMNHAHQQIVVLCVWIALLIVCPLWLRVFRFGPAEWVWRCLTYGRRFPLTRRGEDGTAMGS